MPLCQSAWLNICTKKTTDNVKWLTIAFKIRRFLVLFSEQENSNYRTIYVKTCNSEMDKSNSVAYMCKGPYYFFMLQIKVQSINRFGKYLNKKFKRSTWIIPLPLILSPMSGLSSPLASICPYHALRPFNRVTYVSASSGPASFSGCSVNKWVMNIISDVQWAKYTDLLVALSFVSAATIPENITYI